MFEKKRNNALKSYHEEKANGLADRLMGLWGRGGTVLHFTALT